MTVLDTNFEVMGGGVLRRPAASAGVGSDGDTITHPLRKGPGTTNQPAGQYLVERWTNKGVANFPSDLGARTASALSPTLAGAFGATPA